MQHLSPAETAAIVERAEAEAWVRMYEHVPAGVRAAMGVRATLSGGTGVVAMAGADSGLLNRVMGLGVGEPATEARLDEVLSTYADLGVGNFVVQLSPEAQPAAMTDWLAERGLVPGSAWAKAIRGNDPVVPVATDLTVRAVDPADAEVFGAVGCAGFEMPASFEPLFAGVVGKPGWLAYLAYDGGQPVATGAVHVVGEVAWVGMGSTLPTHRGRGAQNALFARRIEDGIARGCRWFATETGAEDPDAPNGSLRNMLRAGFRVAYLRRNFGRRPAT